MNINETIELLRLLVKMESKVQVWTRIDDGDAMALHPAPNPMSAPDALVAAQAVHDTAQRFGKNTTFSLRRFELYR